MLLAGVSAETPDAIAWDVSAETSQDQARALLADLFDWHRREDKPAWWQYFSRRRLSLPELTGEPDALGGLTGGDVAGQVKSTACSASRKTTPTPTSTPFGTQADGRGEVGHLVPNRRAKETERVMALPSTLLRSLAGIVGERTSVGSVGELRPVIWRVLKPGDGGPWMSSRRVLTPVLGCSRSELPGKPDCASVMKQSAWVSIQVRAFRLVW